jgi:hypothetical protein
MYSNGAMETIGTPTVVSRQEMVEAVVVKSGRQQTNTRSKRQDRRNKDSSTKQYWCHHNA